MLATGPEHTLSRERISVLGKGKDCRGWIKAPEFFDQLYPVSTAQPQPDHDQMRFVTQKQFAAKGATSVSPHTTNCMLFAISESTPDRTKPIR